MSNKQRQNIEAVDIYRPVATGQVKTTEEAAVITIVRLITGEDLMPALDPRSMWQGRRAA